MANSSRRNISLREDIFPNSTTLAVDRDKGLIRGVKLLGLQSANGRTYTAEAIRKAAGLYEGKQVNIDHRDGSKKPRSARDRLGRAVNVQVRPDGLYGDLEYLKAHPMAEAIAEAAERMPDMFGMSHDAYGREQAGSGKNGKPVVIESIERVTSVDLVSDPASVKSLFENYGGPMDPMVADMPMEASPEEKLTDGFKAAILAVLDDDKMTWQQKKSKIGDFLKMHDKAVGGSAAEEEAPMEEEPTEEGAPAPKPRAGEKPLAEDLDTYKRERATRALCDKAGLIPSAGQLRALVALPEQSDQEELIADFVALAEVKAQRPAQENPPSRVRSAPPARVTENKKAAQDAKSFLSAITG